MERITIAFVPVIHSGYINFFKKNNSKELYLLGNEFTKELPYLSREMRALDNDLIIKAIKAFNIFEKIDELTLETLEELKSRDCKFILSDEDISRKFAEKHLKEKDYLLEQVFLRWDGMKALSNFPIEENQIISGEDLDREFISLAQKEANKSSDWWRQVGAVAVKDGKIIYSAYNNHVPFEHTLYIDGDPRNSFDVGQYIEVSNAQHAERAVISRAAKDGESMLGASIYVTTFPCPNCAMDIASAGFKKVYFKDGYSLLNAQETFRSAGIEIIRVKDEESK